MRHDGINFKGTLLVFMCLLYQKMHIELHAPLNAGKDAWRDPPSRLYWRKAAEITRDLHGFTLAQRLVSAARVPLFQMFQSFNSFKTRGSPRRLRRTRRENDGEE